MALYRKDANIWKKANNQHVKAGGAWKEIQNGFVRDAGVWKPYFNQRLYNHPNLYIEYDMEPEHRNSTTIFDSAPTPHSNAGYNSNISFEAGLGINGTDCLHASSDAIAYGGLAYSLASQDLTINFWVYAWSAGQSISRWITLANEAMVIRRLNTNIHTYMMNTDGYMTHSQIGGALSYNNWKMYTMRWNHTGNYWDVFYGANFIGNKTLNGTARTTNTIMISNTGTESLNGRMDSIRIFNKFLTDAEISELYNGGAGY